VATVILKPTVGLGGSNSHQVPLEELADKLNVLRATDPDREYLIQPFIDSVLNEGEWSFVYFSNQLSHVLLKKPAPNEYRVQSIYGGSIQPAEPSPDDLRQAESVRMKLPFDVLYTRLDLMRVDGRLAIMEVELIEPIFSFNLVPESIQRLVHATKFKFKASEK
jgi:glutathione synthase/RimK-type ligase-like ATP-grasp enzyme